MIVPAQMFRILGIAIMTWLAVLPAAAQAQAEPPAFRRGIAIAHSMAWAELEPPPSKAFVFAAFAAQSRRLEAAELQSLRRAGFDFVRLAVDPGPFLQFDGARRDQLDQVLLDQVRLILSSGLAVIVDLHPSDLHPHYTGRALTGGVETPAFRDYVQLLERTAALLDGLKSRRVALELMNEPPVSPDAWQPMLEAAYHAARMRAPDLLLVLPGASEGMPEGLLGLRAAAFRSDPAVLYTFHYYEPFQFTHQGASWNAARHLADVPYPAQARPLRDSLDATAAAIESTNLSQPQKTLAVLDARRMLDSYRRSGFDRAAMARSLDRISAWGKSNGIPIEPHLPRRVRRAEITPAGARVARRRAPAMVRGRARGGGGARVFLGGLGLSRRRRFCRRQRRPRRGRRSRYRRRARTEVARAPQRRADEIVAALPAPAVHGERAPPRLRLIAFVRIRLHANHQIECRRRAICGNSLLHRGTGMRSMCPGVRKRRHDTGNRRVRLCEKC